MLVYLGSGLRQLEVSQLLHCPWDVCSAHHSPVGAVSKDVALRESVLLMVYYLTHIHD